MANQAPAVANGGPEDNIDYTVVPAELLAHHIPLSAIGPAMRLMLKRLEEKSTHIVSVDGIEVVDDLSGLTELLLNDGSVLDFGHSDPDTVGAVLDAWHRQDPRASCARLWKLLVSLRRFDILQVIHNRLLFDARRYLQRPRRPESPPRPPPSEEDERRFDVYVSYCDGSQEDSAKAAEILAWLHEGCLDVISADDRLLGVFPQEEYHRIICRCKRILVLWSRAYRLDNNLLFELNLARSTDPAADRRRVIPVLLDDTPVPGHLAGIVAVRFGHRATRQKLLRSLRDSGGGNGGNGAWPV